MKNNFNQYLIEQLLDKKIECDVKTFKELQNLYYKECHDKCTLIAGDKVKLTRCWDINEHCNPILWDFKLYNDIGKSFIIKEKLDRSYLLEGGIYVPYFVLEKVKEEYIPLDYSDDLIGKVIKHKDFEVKIMIIGQDGTGVFIKQSWDITYQLLMDDYTFADGTACNKLKQ